MVKMHSAFVFLHIPPYYLSFKNTASAFCTRGPVTIICICGFPAEPPNIPHAGDIINQTILIGFSTELECKATGSPLPGNMAGVTDPPLKHLTYNSNNDSVFNFNELHLVQLSLGTKMADH